LQYLGLCISAQRKQIISIPSQRMIQILTKRKIIKHIVNKKGVLVTIKNTVMAEQVHLIKLFPFLH